MDAPRVSPGVVVVARTIAEVLKDAGFEMTRREIQLEVSRRLGQNVDVSVDNVLYRRTGKSDCLWLKGEAKGLYLGRCNGHQDSLFLLSTESREEAQEEIRNLLKVWKHSTPWVVCHRGWYMIWLSPKGMKGFESGEQFIKH